MPSAQADTPVGSPGAGAGQYQGAQALAVDPGNGHVYVADRENRRIDVFKEEDGSFLFAFGWGVVDGESAEAQKCTATCFPGLRGGGAGEFTNPQDVAVDPTSHDVYVLDGSPAFLGTGGFRVQRFGAEGKFIGAWGGGVVSGGAKGTGNLTEGSRTVSGVATTAKAFEAGQAIGGAGIPAGTKIVALGKGTITLSKAASASGTGIAIAAPEGAGNVPLNEIQELAIKKSETFRLLVSTQNPSHTEGETAPIKGNASASEIQEALEALPNVGAGNVGVSGPVIDGKGHSHFQVEFKGPRFADTNLPLMESHNGSLFFFTTQNGASSAESCSEAAPEECAGGVEWDGDGSGNGRFADVAHLAVDPTGHVHAIDSRHLGPSESEGFADRLQEFEAGGGFLKSCAPEGLGKTRGLGADTSGTTYIAAEGKVRKYDSACSLLATFNSPGFGSLSLLSPPGDLFLADASSGAPAITRYDAPTAPGEIAKAFFTEGGGGLGALAVSPSHVFAIEGGQVIEVPLPPEGPLIPKASVKGTPHSVWALIKALIDPEGAETHFRIDYVDKATCEAEAPGHCFDHAKSTGEVLLAEGAKDFALHPAETIAGCTDFAEETPSPCLSPETEYAFRIVAGNANGEEAAEGQFTTGPPLLLGASFATEVGDEGAKLHGEANPLGSPAEGHFEYVDQAHFESEGIGGPHTASTPEFSFGSGEALQERAAQLFPLDPGTTYRYRLVVSDPFTTADGPVHAFTTVAPSPPAKTDCPTNQQFRNGASASLIDCRAYEMVSPLDKNNGDLLTLPAPLEEPGGELAPGRLDQARPDGAKLAYSAYRAFADPQAAPLESQYIATRTERGEAGEGWSTQAISPPREGPSFYTVRAINGLPAQAMSEDLCSGWFIEDTDFALVPEAPEGVPNLYRRANCGAGGWELLTPVKPEGFALEGGLTEYYEPEVQGFSADGARSVFSTPGRLDEALAEGESSCPQPKAVQLYESVGGGALRLVSALPGGEASCGGAAVGTAEENHFHNDSVLGAVSGDASRVYWTDAGSFQGERKNSHGPGKLYLRLNAGNEAAAGGECSPAEPEAACTIAVSESSKTSFWQGSPQGDKALYTVDTGSGSDLYRFELDEAEPQASESTLIAHQVLGLLGASKGLSRVYLVSREADGKAEAEGAEAGAPNLYLAEGGGLRFVARLSGEDEFFSSEPFLHSARVSPDGDTAAFMSASPGLAEATAGYDNTDVTSAAPCGGKSEAGKEGRCDAEVYLYSAAGGGHLACVSCNPSGGRPVGRKIAGSEGGIGETPPVFAAARIPGYEYKLHVSRLLSEDGRRLFFESFESLVPRDSNGQEDVYEWEAASSKAQCLGELGGELYVPASGGCIGLISSGQGNRGAELLDASTDGSDVFFTTLSSLVPQDPGLVDIYDARVGGGFPAPPPAPAPCEGEACQSPPAPPQDPTPASQAFEGPGNLSKAAKKQSKHHHHGKGKKHHHKAKKHGGKR